MRYISLTLLVAVLVAALVLPAASAAQMTKPMTMPENIAIEATQVTVKVVGVNMADRTIQLQMPNGKVRTFKVTKDVKSLATLKKGDTIKSTLLDSLAVYIQKAGGRPTATETQTVILAPKGGMPGVIVADTIRITGKIQLVDMQNRTVTITGPGGMSRTFKVGRNIKNLNSLRAGDDVVVRFTQALAIDVRKPMK